MTLNFYYLLATNGVSRNSPLENLCNLFMAQANIWQISFSNQVAAKVSISSRLVIIRESVRSQRAHQMTKREQRAMQLTTIPFSRQTSYAMQLPEHLPRDKRTRRMYTAVDNRK